MKPLHHGSGCFIPITVAQCPECGGELVARSLQWDAATGAPHAAAIDFHCCDDPDLNHAYHQDKWQPVRDKIAAWCEAIT